MSDYERFTVPDFALQKGGVLPAATLAFKTVGTLNAAKDNVILAPTWYSGNHGFVEATLIGPDRAFDPRKYFIVIPNLLGGGISSSPSNTPPPFDRALVPRGTPWGNVRLQQ